MKDYVYALHSAIESSSAKIQECIFEELKAAIIQHRIAPGDRIIASKLASELEVSITPVRTALFQLEKMGFVCIKKNRFYTVIQYSPQDIKNIYYFRTALETLSAEIVSQKMTDAQYDRLLFLADKVAEEAILSKNSNISRHLAVEQADMAFHSYLVECTGNRYLINAHSNALPQFFYVRQFIDNRLTNSAFADEHHMICQMLKTGNPKLCSTMIDHHLNFSTVIE